MTITEIEQLTGLRFDTAIFNANPLVASEETANLEENKPLNINSNSLPETFEVGKAEDMLSKDTKRQTLNDDIVDIFIATALVNPEGKDEGNEFVSLINLGSVPVDLADWVLMDNSDTSLSFSEQMPETILHSGESFIIKPLGKIRLANNGDIIKLYDADNNRIDWVKYDKRSVSSGKVISFLSPRDTLLQI